MPKVVVTGVETPLGLRVARLAAADPSTEVVVASSGPVNGLPNGVVLHRLDLANDDVKPYLDGAETLVHLVQSVPGTPTAATDDVAVTRRLLDAAGDVGTHHVVVLSSATVYGAWANNPVPLTEDAALRPNPGFAFAAERAEIERLATEWREEHPDSTVSVLRPARAAGSDHRDWLVRALRPPPAVPDHADEPAVQFVDLDDLASAVELARTRRLDGAFNVAPEGAIAGDLVRSLIGAPVKVPLPERAAGRLAHWRFRWGLGPTPPALVPYTLHPWVVAADRLRAEGWAPVVSNEEACVEAHEVGAWATMSPRRRQEIALGAAGVGVIGLLTGVVLGVRRWLRA